jgi:hypothetical protein
MAQTIPRRRSPRHTSSGDTISGCSQLEIGFKVWGDQQCWYWLVLCPHCAGGTIGAAPTEAEAIRDALSSIKNLAGDRLPDPRIIASQREQRCNRERDAGDVGTQRAGESQRMRFRERRR